MCGVLVAVATEMVAMKKAFGSDEGLFALCKKVCSNEVGN